MKPGKSCGEMVLASCPWLGHYWGALTVRVCLVCWEGLSSHISQAPIGKVMLRARWLKFSIFHFQDTVWDGGQNSNINSTPTYMGMNKWTYTRKSILMFSWWFVQFLPRCFPHHVCFWSSMPAGAEVTSLVYSPMKSNCQQLDAWICYEQ